MLMDGQESVVGQSEALAYSRPTPVDTFIRTLYVCIHALHYCTTGAEDSRPLLSRLRVAALARY